MERRKVTHKICSEKSFFLLLLLTAIGFFYVTSCSNQKDITLRYKMEKSFYTSERMRGILSLNLKAATPEDFKKLIRSYRKVIELSSLLPETSIAQDISDIASSAQLRIAELYILQKNLDSAKVSFEKTFQKRDPNYTKTVAIQKSLTYTIAQEIGSNSEAKRLINQGAVDVNNNAVRNPTHKVNVGDNIKVGEKIFLKVVEK